MIIFIREFRRIYSVRRMVIIVSMLIMSCVLYFNEQSGNVLYKQYSEVMERPDYEKIDWTSVWSGVTRLIQEREIPERRVKSVPGFFPWKKKTAYLVMKKLGSENEK